MPKNGGLVSTIRTDTICFFMYNRLIKYKRKCSIIPRSTSKSELHEGYFEYLRSLINQRTVQAQVVICLHFFDKANGVSLGVESKYRSPFIDKYKEGGTAKTLFDGQKKYFL